MATSIDAHVRWRVAGEYRPNNASKAGLLAETQQFLQAYGQFGSLDATRRALIDGALPQRARDTRVTIVEVIQRRLTRWSPPEWVLADLVCFAADTVEPALHAALLLHTVRQDALLSDFVHDAVVPRWAAGDHVLVRADVQHFLDQREPAHPELATWSHATRAKLAGNVLSILRDYGLLKGRDPKQIIEPLVPVAVAEHLVRLLRAEGVADIDLASHTDWQIWLWDSVRAQKMISAMHNQEAMLERSG